MKRGMKNSYLCPREKVLNTLWHTSFLLTPEMIELIVNGKFYFITTLLFVMWKILWGKEKVSFE